MYDHRPRVRRLRLKPQADTPQSLLKAGSPSNQLASACFPVPDAEFIRRPLVGDGNDGCTTTVRASAACG